MNLSPTDLESLVQQYQLVVTDDCMCPRLQRHESSGYWQLVKTQEDRDAYYAGIEAKKRAWMAGRVLKTFCKNVQIMSDVWEDQRFATVWAMAESGRECPVDVSIHEMSGVTADAPEAMWKAWGDWLQKAQARDRQQDKLRSRRDQLALKTVVENMDLAIVVKGDRKGPAVYRLCGIFDGEWGPRARLGVVNADGSSDVTGKMYTSVPNLQRVVPGSQVAKRWQDPTDSELVELTPWLGYAWAYAKREAGTCVTVTDEYGIVWSCGACLRGEECPLRLEAAQASVQSIARTILASSALQYVVKLLDAKPLRIDETTYHQFADIAEWVDGVAWKLPLDEPMPEEVRAEMVRRIVESEAGLVYQEPAKRKRAPKKAATATA